MTEPSFARLGYGSENNLEGRPLGLIKYSDVAVSRAPGVLPARRVQDYTLSNGPPKRPTERQGGVDIFIGGGGDDLPGFGAMKDYASSYSKETGRPTLYFPNGRKAEVLKAIAAHQDGGPVNIVGHSWGGTDAYNAGAVARREGLHVDNVVTIDPVGGNFFLAGREPGERPRNWTNVAAHPVEPDESDAMAALGGKPSELPVTEADRQYSVKANHVDVGAMMAAGGRTVLDESRRFAGGSDLHDGIPAQDWVKRRDSHVAGRR